MPFPITGTIYFFGSLIIFFLAWKFLKYGKKENNVLGKSFGYGFFLVALHRFLIAIPALLLLENQKIWFLFEIMARVSIVSALTILGYGVYSMRTPKYAKKITFIFLIISIAIVVTTIFSPPYYFIKGGILYWNPSLLLSVLSTLLVFITIIPGAFFIFQEMRTVEKREAKIRTFGLGLSIVWFAFSGIIDYFLTKINQAYSDINFAVAVIILLIIILLTYPLPGKKLTIKD